MVIAKLAELGWATMQGLADRFEDEAAIGTDADALGFRAGTNNYNDNSERLTRAHIRTAWRAANTVIQTRTKPDLANPSLAPLQIMVGGQRESMEAAYKTAVGERPPLNEQGSDHLCGTMFKEVSKGRIPVVTWKELVPKVQDEYVPTHTIRKRSKD